jgi:hypothetical protein
VRGKIGREDRQPHDERPFQRSWGALPGDRWEHEQIEGAETVLWAEWLARLVSTGVFSAEGWYNPHRRHSGIDFKSLFSYERSYSPATWIPSPQLSTEPG